MEELSKLPSGSVIVDLGCGDGALAKSLIPKGYCVLSFDLKSDNDYVIQADICDRLPLPGSEINGSMESGQVTNIVVCSLSLMSTNWVNCIREAWRILRDQ